MKISRHQVIAFAAVGKKKSFSAAAKHLGIGQSAVTQHIAALEQAIGSKLFVRSRSGAELTAMGRDLYAVADKIRVLEELFLERAYQYGSLDVGHLSVCVSTPRPAIAIVSAYQRAYPGVKVDLVTSPWMEAINKVRNREVDLAIVITPERTDGLFSVEIERRPFVALVPVQHPFAKRKSIRLAELTQEAFIMLTETSYTRYAVNKKMKASGLVPQVVFTISSYEMVFEAVANNLGVSIALDGAITRFNEVATVPIEEFTELHAYTVVCAEDNANLRLIQGFLELAKEQAK
ncbi:LysR family transcriptional regulator [Thiosocius teredinicola]|uniref:LysR family transcriptional regulator n=1 Tax=Thiosocius teredinicola TaxID=1973002 RepID=UPI00099139F1